MLRLLRLLAESLYDQIQARRPSFVSRHQFLTVYSLIEELLYVISYAILLVVLLDILCLHKVLYAYQIICKAIIQAPFRLMDRLHLNPVSFKYHILPLLQRKKKDVHQGEVLPGENPNPDLVFLPPPPAVHIRPKLGIEDPSGLLGSYEMKKLRDIASITNEVTNAAVVFFIMQFTTRIDRSLSDFLRERCIQTSGNCVLVVLHRSDAQQTQLDELRAEYESVSGLTTSEAMKHAWNTNGQHASVEHSTILFVESLCDDSGEITILRLKNPDYFVHRVQELVNQLH